MRLWASSYLLSLVLIGVCQPTCTLKSSTSFLISSYSFSSRRGETDSRYWGEGRGGEGRGGEGRGGEGRGGEGRGGEGRGGEGRGGEGRGGEGRGGKGREGEGREGNSRNDHQIKFTSKLITVHVHSQEHTLVSLQTRIRSQHQKI